MFRSFAEARTLFFCKISGMNVQLLFKGNNSLFPLTVNYHPSPIRTVAKKVWSCIMPLRALLGVLRDSFTSQIIYSQLEEIHLYSRTTEFISRYVSCYPGVNVCGFPQFFGGKYPRKPHGFSFPEHLPTAISPIQPIPVAQFHYALFILHPK